MTNISNNSVYDLATHTPIITQKYITETTGFDLSIMGDQMIGTVDGQIKMLTLQAKAYLFGMRTYETQQVLEYLIATQLEWRNAFEYYACMYVYQSLFDPEWEKVPKNIAMAINGSLLKTEYFTASIIYEVKNSELEW